MRKALLITLILISNACFSEQIHVKCWSNHNLIFNQNVKNVIPGEGYIVTEDDLYTSIVTGDCVIRYRNPPKKH